MGLHGELWQVAASDAKLGGGESARLTEALDANEELRAELTYLLRHLSANLGGEFLRAFVDLLEDQQCTGARRLS